MAIKVICGDWGGAAVVVSDCGDQLGVGEGDEEGCFGQKPAGLALHIYGLLGRCPKIIHAPPDKIIPTKNHPGANNGCQNKAYIGTHPKSRRINHPPSYECIQSGHRWYQKLFMLVQVGHQKARDKKNLSKPPFPITRS